MLKRIALAAMALVVLAAATPASAQFRRGPQPTWFEYKLDQVRDIPEQIWDGHDRAMERIERRYQENVARRDGYQTRGADEWYRDGLIPRPTGRLGPYIWGTRYPWDDCHYSWVDRRTCRNYSDYQIGQIVIEAGGAAATIWNARETRKLRQEVQRSNDRYDAEDRLDAIDERYQTRPQERHPDAVRAQPPPEQPRSRVLVNLTGCPAKVMGIMIGGDGRIEIPAGTARILVDVQCPVGSKHLDPIGDSFIGLTCR